MRTLLAMILVLGGVGSVMLAADGNYGLGSGAKTTATPPVNSNTNENSNMESNSNTESNANGIVWNTNMNSNANSPDR